MGSIILSHLELGYNNCMLLDKPIESISEPEGIYPTGLEFGHTKDLDPRLVDKFILSEELTPIWDELLAKPGDSVIARGSRIEEVLAGGIVSAADSDLDIFCDFGKLKGFDPDNCCEKRQAGDTKVGLANTEVFRQIDIQALLQLEAIALQRAKPDTAKRLALLRQKIQTASVEDLLAYDGFFAHETLGIKLERQQDNTIIATLLDPRGVLSSTNSTDAMQRSADFNLHPNLFTLAMSDGAEASYFEAISAGVPMEVDTLMPVWGLKAIPRSITKVTERYVSYSNTPEANIGLENKYFIDMARDIIARVSSGGLGIDLGPDALATLEKAGYGSIEEYVVTKCQIAFARGCKTNPLTAFDYCFGQLEMQKLIFEDVTLNKPFEDAKDTYTKVCQSLYNTSFVQLQPTDSNLTLHRNKSINSVTNMSDVFALLILAFDIDANDIDKLVENWQVSGKLKNYRAPLDNADFDISIDADKIKTKLKELYAHTQISTN